MMIINFGRYCRGTRCTPQRNTRTALYVRRKEAGCGDFHWSIRELLIDDASYRGKCGGPSHPRRGGPIGVGVEALEME